MKLCTSLAHVYCGRDMSEDEKRKIFVFYRAAVVESETFEVNIFATKSIWKIGKFYSF